MLRSLSGKQCGPRSDCSYRSSLFWVHSVCFYTLFVSNARQLFATDDFSRRHFFMHFFLDAFKAKFNLPHTFMINFLLHISVVIKPTQPTHPACPYVHLSIFLYCQRPHRHFGKVTGRRALKNTKKVKE